MSVTGLHLHPARELNTLVALAATTQLQMKNQSKSDHVNFSEEPRTNRQEAESGAAAVEEGWHPQSLSVVLSESTYTFSSPVSSTNKPPEDHQQQGVTKTGTC